MKHLIKYLLNQVSAYPILASHRQPVGKDLTMTSQNKRILFKQGTILTMDPATAEMPVGDLLVEDGRIAAIAADLQADGAEIINARGGIILPGLVDAHHHMWLGAMRRLMPNVDDLFAYIGVVAETLGKHYRPEDMHASTRLTALACLDAGITTVIDACHSSRSPEHTDAALDALDGSGIRALHMVGAAMDKSASAAHISSDLKRIALKWNQGGNRVQAGIFGQF
ncbi:amidohydrolase family protein, partial [Thioclava sp. BHET1]